MRHSRVVKTFSVLLQCNNGRNMVFIVDAVDQNIAIDACVRSALLECPSQSFRHLQASEITLNTPMKIMDSGDDT